MRIRGKFTLLVATLLVATLLVFLVSFQVRTSETAIVYTFRKASRVIKDAGFYLKLPYPIQTVTKYSKRTNIYEGRFQEYLTKDQHNLIVNIAIGWSIADPGTFEEKVGSRGKAEEKLAALIGGAANAVINSHDLADFVSTGTGHQYGAVEANMHKLIKEDAAEQYGLDVPFLLITQLGLPEDVTKQVFERNKEERGSKAKDLRAQGDSKAETIRAEADRQAKDILSKAEADARITRGEGDRMAAKYYEVFKQDPDLANFLSSLDAIRHLKRRATYILTPDDPPFNLFDRNLKIPGSEPAKAPDPPKGSEQK